MIVTVESNNNNNNNNSDIITTTSQLSSSLSTSRDKPTTTSETYDAASTASMMCHDTSANSERIDYGYNGKKNDNNCDNNSADNKQSLCNGNTGEPSPALRHQQPPQSRQRLASSGQVAAAATMVAATGQVRRQPQAAPVVVAERRPMSTMSAQQWAKPKVASPERQPQQRHHLLSATCCCYCLLALLLAMGCLHLQPVAGNVVGAHASGPAGPATRGACQWPASSGYQQQQEEDEAPRELVELLVLLRCQLKPLVEVYGQLLAAEYGQAALWSPQGTRMNDLETQRVWFAYSELNQLIDHFFYEAEYLLSRRRFCTYSVVARFAALRQRLGAHNSLLPSLFDILAILYHQTCLVDAIEKLPPVPYIVRDVVEIYIGGADTALSVYRRPAARKVFEEQGPEEKAFDVREALAKNGRLEDVMKLVLSIPGQAAEVSVFRDKCQDFLIEIDERWQSMEMMSRLLATESNGIQRFNNYVMRQLIPTKYADICTRLSRAD